MPRAFIWPAKTIKVAMQPPSAGFKIGAICNCLHVCQWEEGLAHAAGSKLRSARASFPSKLRWVGRPLGAGARRIQDELRGARPAPAAGGSRSPRRRRSDSQWLGRRRGVRATGVRRGAARISTHRPASRMICASARPMQAIRGSWRSSGRYKRPNIAGSWASYRVTTAANGRG